MESVLKKNIEKEMQSRGMKKLTELGRLTRVPYRTLQDIMDEKSTARISTVAAIAYGFGISPGKLLEEEQEEMPKKTAKSDALTIRALQSAVGKLTPDLVEILTQLDDAAIARLVGFAKTMIPKSVEKVKNKAE